jgi:hypothetical protein
MMAIARYLFSRHLNSGPRETFMPSEHPTRYCPACKGLTTADKDSLCCTRHGTATFASPEHATRGDYSREDVASGEAHDRPSPRDMRRHDGSGLRPNLERLKGMLKRA